MCRISQKYFDFQSLILHTNFTLFRVVLLLVPVPGTGQVASTLQSEHPKTIKKSHAYFFLCTTHSHELVSLSRESTPAKARIQNRNSPTPSSSPDLFHSSKLCSAIHLLIFLKTTMEEKNHVKLPNSAD